MRTPPLIAIPLLALAATPLSADPEWVTQQSARLVVGQPSFTRQSPTSGRTIIGSAGGVAVGGDRLFVAEGNRIGATPINNRVLIYDDLDGFVPELEAELPQESNCPACIGVPAVVLGQPDFETFDTGVMNGMRAPAGVATDGTVLAVADTNNNRVLLWRQIPTTSSTPPDVVLGQPDGGDNTPRTSAEGMRGPQGVWVADGKLFVADTQNSRVLIWNQIPTSNGASANVVLGQPDFDTRPEPDLTRSNFDPTATAMIDPTSVTVSDGKLFVADLGFDRVLIFNSIPTSNQAPADVVVGQPDMITAGVNDDGIERAVAALCEEISIFADDGSVTPDDAIFPPPISRAPPGEEEPTTQLPRRCERTLNFPRFALAQDGKLYIADSGNDRILIYNEIPTSNGAAADIVIGQPNFIALEQSVQPGAIQSPTSLAHDGKNLYVADPFTRRILIFTEAEDLIAHQGIRNGASFQVQATGFLQFVGTAEEGQDVEIDISGREYNFTTGADETASQIRDQVIEMINNDPDTLVTAHPFNGAGTFARARIRFTGGVIAGELIAVTVGDQRYEAIVQPDDQPFNMVDRLVFEIDKNPHPLVLASRDLANFETLLFTARTAGDGGNDIPVSIEIPPGSPLQAELSGNALSGGVFPRRVRLTAIPSGRRGNAITVRQLVDRRVDALEGSTSGSRLTGGGDARFIPNGSFAAIFGEDLAAETILADASQELPKELGGVQVYINGRLAPIFSVSPEQVNFMVPWEIEGIGSTTYVRRRMPDGSVRVSVPRGNEVTRAAPGLFALPGLEPRQAVAVHGAGQATATVALTRPAPRQVNAEPTEVLEGNATASIIINGRRYSYDAVSGETLTDVRDRLIELINAGDPEVTAAPGRVGFFSARANVDLTGEPAAGNRLTVFISNRAYTYVVQDGDTLEVVRNVIVDQINSGLGDRDVTARVLQVVGDVTFQVIARSLGTDGNEIPFAIEVDGDGLMAETNVAEEGLLQGGQTPPVVELIAIVEGREGNEIEIEGDSSDTAIISSTPRTRTLCCGNIPFSLITEDNPAIPGEIIIVFGSGLGFPSPLPSDAGLISGVPTPTDQMFNVPFNADDFVSSLAGGRTASVRFAGLMPGFPGIYQINLKLNEGLADDPVTPLTIAQVLFISNTVTIPVKNIRPTDPDDFDLRF